MERKIEQLVYGREAVRRQKQPKTQKCISCLFLSLRWTVSQPYRLSHINTLGINQSY